MKIATKINESSVLLNQLVIQPRPYKLLTESVKLIAEYAPELTPEHAERIARLVSDLVLQYTTNQRSSDPVVSRLTSIAK